MKKKDASTNCYTKIRGDMIPFFVYESIYPPVKNRYSKSIYCTNGITYGFLKKLVKKGISTKHGNASKFDNKEAILNQVNQHIKRNQFRLDGLQKISDQSDQINKENKATVKHIKELYHNTEEYAYIGQCGSHENELFPISQLPDGIEERKVYMDMMLTDKNGEVCKHSDIYLYRNGEWGEKPANSMLGYHSKYIKDPIIIEKLNNAKKKLDSKK